MNDCYYDRKDWRACAKEVSIVATLQAYSWRTLMMATIRCKPSKNVGNEKATRKELKPRMYKQSV